MRLHSRQDRRFLCTECHQTFRTAKGTALYRLRTPAQTGTLVVTLWAHGGPLHAIIVAFGFDERTVARWWSRAGVQGQAVQEHRVPQPRDLGHVQADAIRVKKPGGIGWMALVMMVTTRVWVAGEVSAHRDRTQMRRLIERVRAWALPRPLLCCPNGWCSDIRARRETCRDPVPTEAHGRPRLCPWRNACLAQVVRYCWLPW